MIESTESDSEISPDSDTRNKEKQTNKHQFSSCVSLNKKDEVVALSFPTLYVGTYVLFPIPNFFFIHSRQE